MALHDSANILIEYNKWRRLQKKYDRSLHDKIKFAIKEVYDYMIAQENKIFKTHIQMFDTYIKFRNGTLKEEPVSFQTKLGESIDFVAQHILKGV